jgi:hypothetical protein
MTGESFPGDVTATYESKSPCVGGACIPFRGSLSGVCVCFLRVCVCVCITYLYMYTFLYVHLHVFIYIIHVLRRSHGRCVLVHGAQV